MVAKKIEEVAKKSVRRLNEPDGDTDIFLPEDAITNAPGFIGPQYSWSSHSKIFGNSLFNERIQRF